MKAPGVLILLLLLAGCRSDRSPDADPYYGYAWHLHESDPPFAERYGVDDDAHIHVEAAWEQTRGAGSVIAIIDDTFEPSHPDIASRIHSTYNAADGSTTVTNDTQTASHGQRCAGVAAAAINAIGVVGVAPEAKLMLISHGYDTDVTTIRAFEYAHTHGADVISCSWGSYQVSEAVADVIQTVRDSGITVVFAAGNEGRNLDGTGINDESELAAVIGVSASDESNDHAAYANYGSALDLVAPGGTAVGIPTTDETGNAGKNDATGLMDSDYTFFSGTSAAAPIVAATAALLYSAHPGISPRTVYDTLTDTADKIGGNYGADDFSEYFGYGKVNAGAAVAALP